MLNKNRITNFLTVVLIMLFLFSFVYCEKQENNKTDNQNKISVTNTWNGLSKSISEAKDGDVIYVDDIDFTPSSSDEDVGTRKKTIKNSVKIKSGKQDGIATLTKPMFEILGSNIPNEKISVTFENIVFDGNIDTGNLTTENYPADEYYTHTITFGGNVKAVFENCVFKNFTAINGSVFEIKYGEEYSTCTLDLTFNKCSIINNASLYSGGAMYIESKDNVTINMNECTLSNNKSGAVYGIGGGAIYAKSAKINLKDCTINNNQCNYYYPEIFDDWFTDYKVDIEEAEKVSKGEIPNNGGDNLETVARRIDPTRGGGMLLDDCNLNMTDCLIKDNISTQGGGIALTGTKADFDGCKFIENKAQKCTYFNKYQLSLKPWDCLGVGGALYLDGVNDTVTTLTNSYFYGNEAEVGYGGIYKRYWDYIADPGGITYLKLNCCTYVKNKCNQDYDYTKRTIVINEEYPENIWESKYVTTIGCLIIDETFNEFAFNKQENPSAENSYNYFGTLQNANSDGIEIKLDLNNSLSVKLPKDQKWTLPKDVLAEITQTRYNGKLTKAVIGSNYKKELYNDSLIENKNLSNVWLYVGAICGAVVVIGLVVGVILWRKNKLLKHTFATPSLEFTDISMQELGVSNIEQNSTQKFVYVRYTEEQVDEIMESVVEVQSFTNREREIFREMLLGKKQSEIASKLYISTSTVKDFYQKIYIKMGVDNKDALFKKIFDETKK